MKKYIRSARGKITKLDELDTSRLDEEQKAQIRRGLEEGLDVSWYADPKFRWWEMDEIRRGLEAGLDVSQFADPKFDWEQMREIRFRLQREQDIDPDSASTKSDSTKSNSSSNSNWPDPSYWDQIEFDDDMELAWDNYLSGPEGTVESELQLYFEPSIQGGDGGMFIFDESGEDKFEPIEVDYALWCDTELELASESSSAEEYKQKFKDYVLNLIG